jgi:FkbM family methyltransferase
MTKLLSAAKLLLSGNVGQFRRRLRINLRGRRLRRSRGRPFVYSLGAFPFVCIPGLPDSEETFLTGESDAFELQLLRHWLLPRDAFVDIGANLGLYSFAACHFLHGDGTFLGLEASPDLHQHLCQSATLLGLTKIAFEQRVIGDETKDVDFFVAPPTKSLGEQGLHPDPVRSGDYVPRRLRMEPLTSILVHHPAAARPAAVKLDIEGAEPLALRGAPTSWLTDTGPLWIVEVNPTALARSGETCAALLDFFPPTAFERWLAPQFAMTGDRTLPLRLLRSGERFDDAWFYNLIAVPRAAVFAKRRSRIAAMFPAA